jgi:Uma2 family endonuclease
VGVPTIKTGPVTVEEYFAFTDTRPDNEKWELIDGEPILNASPSKLHQTILFNLAFILGSVQRQRPQSRCPESACEYPRRACQSQIFLLFPPGQLDGTPTADRPMTSS